MLAHELGHVKNRDILVATMAVTMVGVVALLSDFGMRFLYWAARATVATAATTTGTRRPSSPCSASCC